MERLLEDTWGTGWFQYRTLFLNTFELVGMQVTLYVFTRVVIYRFSTGSRDTEAVGNREICRFFQNPDYNVTKLIFNFQATE